MSLVGLKIEKDSNFLYFTLGGKMRDKSLLEKHRVAEESHKIKYLRIT